MAPVRYTRRAAHQIGHAAEMQLASVMQTTAGSRAVAKHANYTLPAVAGYCSGR